MWSLLAVLQIVSGEPNPPIWPSSVQVFGPEDAAATIQAAVNAAYALNGGQPDIGQFSPHRFVFMFKPGSYNVEVPVGYYTQILGLGTHPSEVIFTSSKGVYSQESNFAVNPGALNTFWRSAENFQTDATYAWNTNGNKGMLWAASQAAALRRLIVSNDLDLYEFHKGDLVAGFSSGGFLGNSLVKGSVSSGSQQQYLARNSQVGAWKDGVWNEVFVGTINAPPSHCGMDAETCAKPFVTVDTAPIVAEKPFISISPTGTYQLNVPKPVQNLQGLDYQDVEQVGFEQVYVADPAKDTAQSINAKLAQGLHVVLSPGIYDLTEPLVMATNNQVLLGLGLATLRAKNSQGALQVKSCGARVAGLLVAMAGGTTATSPLLLWEKSQGSCSSPGIMSDIYLRVGGPIAESPVKAEVMLQVDADNVVIDNSWLWRADHVESGQLVQWQNPCQEREAWKTHRIAMACFALHVESNLYAVSTSQIFKCFSSSQSLHVGAIINGNNVVAYGFKAEHALTDQVQWNGQRGRTFMFQAEMPYEVTQATFGDKGYAGYRVSNTVTSHEAHGVGVYHYFRDAAVTVQSAIAAPAALEPYFASPLSVFLNGKGVVLHVINDKGPASMIDPKAPKSAVPRWFCNSSSAAAVDVQSGGICKLGDSVFCPGSTVQCRGNTCCPDGSACPSAAEDYNCCTHGKKQDCLKPFEVTLVV